MNTNKIFFILLLLGFMTACHDDIEDDRQVTNGPTFVPTNIVSVQSDVLGYVYDEQQQAISNAMVSLVVGDNIKNTFTNTEGLFTFKNEVLDAQGTYIKVEKDGYILGSDRVYPVNDEATVYSYIHMYKLNSNEAFMGNEGGTIVVEGGGSIEFGTNSISDADGNAYTGRVVYTAKRIATDDPLLGDKMPGGLYGLDKEGKNVSMATLGMIAVELRGSNNVELNLLAGKTAHVVFPIAEKDLASAPNEIPLWSFDEVNGIWVEEGTAVKVGNTYEGEVSHFSFWNCDAPFPLVQVCGNLIYENGQPASGLYVAVNAEGLGVSAGYSDNQGNFSGKMPAGVELTIEISSWACQDEITTITVGPFDTKTTIEQIVLPSIEPFTFSGTVVCDGDLVSDALVVVESGFYKFFTSTDADGAYSITISDQLCAEDPEFTILAINNETGETSERTILIDGSQTDITLVVCQNCDFTAEIINDTEPCNNELGTLSVSILSGTGNYTYEWNRGQTTSSIDYEVSDLYEVTITDETGNCHKILSTFVEVDSFQLQAFGNITTLSCIDNLHEISIQVSGGTAPYSYEWSDGITLPASDQYIVSNLSPGTYVVKVTDANGCELLRTFVVSDAQGFNLEFFSDVVCDPEISVIPLGGVQPFTYEWTLDGATFASSQFAFRDLSGTYCVRVTDALGCTEEICEYFDGYQPIFWDNFSNCVDSGMVYTNLFPEYTYSFDYGMNRIVDVSNTDTYFHDPIQYGYEFIVTIFDNTNGCVETFESRLTFFEGMTITNASNSTIDVDISGGGCNGCNAVGPFIYLAGDLSTDLSAMNGNLAPGDYIVALRNENTDCLIAHELVTLN